MNDYLELSADDKTIGIRFGMQSIMSISADGIMDANVNGEGDKTFVTTSAITKMAYHGYLNWCLWQGTPVELSRKEFIDFLDDVFMSDMTVFSKIVEAFENSKALKKMKDAQKKMTGKSSPKSKPK